MFRTALLATALAMPVAASPAVAEQNQAPSMQQGQQAQQGQGQQDGMSYGEKARANQPETVGEIDNLNSGERAVARSEDMSIARGDRSFAMPLSALIDRPLMSGFNDELGEITDVILGPDNRATKAIIDLGGRQVAIPYEDLRVRTGRGPEDLMVVAGYSPAELAQLPDYAFGGGMAAVTAPDSAAAELKGNLGIGEGGAQEGGVPVVESTDRAPIRDTVPALDSQRSGQGAAEGSGTEQARRDEVLLRDQRQVVALQVPTGDGTDPLVQDQTTAAAGGLMDDWYRVMANEWQSAQVPETLREQVNDEWGDVVDAWGAMRRAAEPEWPETHQAFLSAFQDFRDAYANAIQN